MTKSVSLKPSDMTADPQPLNTGDKRVMDSILSMGLMDFMASYSYPPKEKRGYFHITYQPEVWVDSVKHFSENHLFLYTFCQARRDVKHLVEVREQAKDICRRTTNEAGMLWLAQRPKYSFKMSAFQNERQFPAWDEEQRTGFTDLSRQGCGTTARILFIVVSSKVMLESGVALDWRGKLEKDVKDWNAWLEDEVAEISRFFSLV